MTPEDKRTKYKEGHLGFSIISSMLLINVLISDFQGWHPLILSIVNLAALLSYYVMKMKDNNNNEV